MIEQLLRLPEQPDNNLGPKSDAADYLGSLVDFRVSPLATDPYLQRAEGGVALQFPETESITIPGNNDNAFASVKGCSDTVPMKSCVENCES